MMRSRWLRAVAHKAIAWLPSRRERADETATTQETPPADDSSVPHSSGVTIDPALDWPLGIEPVGAIPREIIRLETDPPDDVLPRGAVLRTALGAGWDAVNEMGYRIGAMTYFVWRHRSGKGRGAARFSDPVYSTPSQYPAYIRVDLSEKYTRQQIIESIIRAYLRASRSPRQPELVPGGWIDDIEDRWPEIRSRPRNTHRLRERLRSAAEAADAATPTPHIGLWFMAVGEAIEREAFESAVVATLSGTGSASPGFQATWYPGTPPPLAPALHFDAASFSYQETVSRVADLVAYAHGAPAGSAEADTVAGTFRAAAFARMARQPVTVPLLKDQNPSS